MKYLIVECSALQDAYECEYKKTPLKIVNDYKEWYEENKKIIKKKIEIYQIDDNGDLQLIKDCNTYFETGMALYYWNSDDEPHILYKWENQTRSDDIPDLVKQYFDNITDEDLLDLDCGYMSKPWNIDNENVWLVYGEYEDNYFTSGY